MAEISVTGVVARIFFNGKGVQVNEPYKAADGSTKYRKYTAWFNEPVNFTEGAEGNFTGTYSSKIENWTNPDGTVKLDNTGKPGQSITTALNNTIYTPKGGFQKLPDPVGAKVASGDWYPVNKTTEDQVWATEAKFVQDAVKDTLNDLPF